MPPKQSNPALQPHTLWWNGTHGQVFVDGITGDLRSAPRFSGLSIAELDYAPRVRLRGVRETGGEWRDLTPAEIAAVEATLRRAANVFRTVLC